MKVVRKSALQRLEAYFWPEDDTFRDCTFESPPDEDGVQVSSALDARGRELPDPVPMAPPVGYRDGPSLAEFVQRMIRQEVSRIAADNEYESFDEAEDFDVEDDPLDPMTPYEEVFDPRFQGAPTPPSEAEKSTSSPAAEPQPAPSPAAAP